MCVIIMKPKGSSMPDKSTLWDCWERNPDGAGLMFIDKDGYIRIDKGYMTFKQFKKAINKYKFSKQDQVVLHFRLSTGGGVTPENTHPFPVTDETVELQALDTVTDKAMVHNGIIGASEGNLSDTAVFVRDCLAQNSIKNMLSETGVQNLLSYAFGTDKVLILDTEKKITLKLGHWHYEDGLYFSNMNWKTPVWNYGTYTYGTVKKGKQSWPYPQDNLPQEVETFCPECHVELYQIGPGYYCDICDQGYVLDAHNELYAVPADWLEDWSEDETVYQHCPDCQTLMEYSGFMDDYFYETCARFWQLGEDGEFYDVSTSMQ